MHSDPHAARTTGLQRLRVATVAVGMAAAVGTGVLTWSMAAEASTTEETSAAEESTTDESTTSDSSTDMSTEYSAPEVESDDFGDADASSGGS